MLLIFRHLNIKQEKQKKLSDHLPMLNGQMDNVRHDGSRSHKIMKDTDVLTLKLWMIAMFRITLAKSFQFTALWFVSNPKLSAMTYNRIETIFSIAMHTLQKLTCCTCWPCMYINVNWDFGGFEVLAIADWPHTAQAQPLRHMVVTAS